MLQGHNRPLMELPVKEPFSQIIVLLSANVKKGPEAGATTTKLKFSQYHKYPQTFRLVHKVQNDQLSGQSVKEDKKRNIQNKQQSASRCRCGLQQVSVTLQQDLWRC